MHDTDIHPEFEAVAIPRRASVPSHGQRGASIGGYPLAALATNATYEESVYLLLHDRLPDPDELSDFRADLARRRVLTDSVKKLLRRTAAEEKPVMDALRMDLAAGHHSSLPPRKLRFLSLKRQYPSGCRSRDRALSLKSHISTACHARSPSHIF